MSLQPINKHTVLKQVRDTGVFKGFIAPNKVNAGDVNDNWHIGMSIEIFNVTEEDGKKVPYVRTGTITANTLENVLNNFMYYNCNAELGNRVRFWCEI